MRETWPRTAIAHLWREGAHLAAETKLGPSRLAASHRHGITPKPWSSIPACVNSLPRSIVRRQFPNRRNKSPRFPDHTIAERFLLWGKGHAADQTLTDPSATLALSEEFTKAVSFSNDPVECLRSMCKLDASLDRHQRQLQQHWDFLRQIHHLSASHTEISHPYVNSQPDDLLNGNDELFDAQLRSLRARLAEEDRRPYLVEDGDGNNVEETSSAEVTNNLINDLMWRAHCDTFPDESAEALRYGFENFDQQWKQIQHYQKAGLPRYEDIDIWSANRNRKDLNRAFNEFFDRWNEHSLKTRVSHICANILACKSALDIHNYNTLILGFTGLRLHGLAGVVVDRYLDDAGLRPSGDTFDCILLHYQAKGDILGFFNILRRLTAIDSRGMLLGRSPISVDEPPNLALTATSTWSVTSLQGDWTVNIAEYQPDLYTAIISGLLSFDRVKDAAKVFVTSLQNTGTADVLTFRRLMRKCIYNMDDAATEIIIRGLAGNSTLAAELLLDKTCPAKVSGRLHDLLHLVISTNADHSAVQLAKALDPMLDARGPWGCMNVTRAIYLRQIEDHLARVDLAVRTTKLALRTYRFNGSKAIRKALDNFRSIDLYYHRRYVNRRRIAELAHLSHRLRSRTPRIYPAVVNSNFHYIMHAIRVSYFHQPEPCMRIASAATSYLRYRLERDSHRFSPYYRLVMEIEIELAITRQLVRMAKWFLLRAEGRTGHWPDFAKLEGRFARLSLNEFSNLWEDRQRRRQTKRLQRTVGKALPLLTAPSIEVTRKMNAHWQNEPAPAVLQAA